MDSERNTHEVWPDAGHDRTRNAATREDLYISGTDGKVSDPSSMFGHATATTPGLVKRKFELRCFSAGVTNSARRRPRRHRSGNPTRIPFLAPAQRDTIERGPFPSYIHEPQRTLTGTQSDEIPEKFDRDNFPGHFQQSSESETQRNYFASGWDLLRNNEIPLPERKWNVLGNVDDCGPISNPSAHLANLEKSILKYVEICWLKDLLPEDAMVFSLNGISLSSSSLFERDLFSAQSVAVIPSAWLTGLICQIPADTLVRDLTEAERRAAGLSQHSKWSL